MRLITNSQDKHGRLKNILIEEAKDANLCIASAFFTDWETMEKFVSQNCTVSLIVRLGTGTSAEALEKAMKLGSVDIRFFNDQHFHPKFYIIGQRIAYVGSANFTNNGLMRNQETTISLEDKDTLEELQQIFNEYWDAAEPLSPEKLQVFKDAMKGRPSEDNAEFHFAKRLEKEMGLFAFNNAGLEEKKLSLLDKSISKFQKEYQNFLSSYRQLSNIYESYGQRRWDSIPLRIEIDRFVWWVGETYGAAEKYEPIAGLSLSQVAERVTSFIPEFLASTNKWLEHDAIPRYQQIADAFSSKEQLETMSDEEIADILGNCVFSFNTNRFYKDGVENHKNLFLEKNPKGKIQRTIKYLLFGQEKYPIRLARCIHDAKYKLETIGESGITELFGLANHEDIPIRNQRVTKTLPWLGF